ncbi:uncharacterized protein LTR77_008718 [Saxophila tyrrhenica]|uniref:Zn(2)-C6 fungal-type domain-containing protein n=1 Tax=Saxophila tyrrhenica TaxID=1690608 RepID=A0AAV9P208_9PEZI|nr:hypothetical protein LTR77_008718 [Saxophila tyrrhenica]
MMTAQLLDQSAHQPVGMTGVYTPSSDEHKSTPQGDEISTSRPSAPSDFFKTLPSSANNVFSAEQPNGTPIESTRVHVDAHGRTLNPRSCVTCRKRKVKCNKIHPCNNCNRAHIECVFPSPGRAPRKINKPSEGRDKELLERLRRLEGVVKGLGVEVDDKENGEQDEQAVQQDGQDGTPDELHKENNLSKSGANDRWAYQYFDGNRSDRTRWVDEKQRGNFETRFGRLVVNEGKSRYINNSFWANLSNEVEDLKGILNQSSDEEDVDESPDSHTNLAGVQQGWVFGFSSLNVDLLSLHPLPGQISAYWSIYKDRVDPLVKVLHIPTIEPTILSAASHLSNLSKGFEALLFTIYYGATTSLNAEDCKASFGEEKTVLLARYRFAIEQALSRANFLTTEETIVLQAFVIFLICLRRNNDARVIWTLTGLVVRIAQTLGVHRDGTHFGLPPFEIEMRRRLWWQVCILDTRASEDHGCDPTIMEQSFDTKMPLNVNDVDIGPDMKEFPLERTGCTDMSFCLIRFEVANTFRRINYVPPGPPRQCKEYYKSITLQDKETWITECHNRLEERYLKHCDMSVPLFWVTATVARLMMSKMWLMVYHPFQRQDGGASLPDETKEKLFITSLENIEYSILLETEARTMKWGWLFKTYMQWHALAFILSELCQRTTGDLVDRAWRAVEKSKDGRWGVRFTDDSRADHLWRPLRKLYRKAKDARARGIQEEALTKPQLTPQRTYSPNANPMFEHPERPRMTRAPLSQAQAQRFASGPTFGEVPVDKHELFRSPKLLETVGGEDVDPMDAISLQNTGRKQQPDYGAMPNGANMPLNSGYAMHDALSSSQAMQQPNPQYTAPTSFPNLPTNTMPLDFSTTNNGTFYPPRANSLDSNGELDMSIMDTSGDINWENWDQLVKQFGMDVDSVPGAGVATDWAGGGWDVLANGVNGVNGTSGVGGSGEEWFR